MVLKRQEKDNKIKAIYKSSNILASTYEKDTNNLTIVFNKGTQYKYVGVSLTDYTRFELAESQGKVFNSHIKSHSFEKLDDFDATIVVELSKEVEKLHTEEQQSVVKAKSDKLISKMKDIIALTGDSIIDSKELNLLNGQIINYLNETNE